MNWLASDLVYLGILSSQDQDKISSMTFPLTSDERADIIVSAIMDKLKLDCNNLRSILKVLRKRPNPYKETIALLEGNNICVQCEILLPRKEHNFQINHLLYVMVV